jgi:pimeloyl-ACP methyl ester carboxylesterase
MPVVTRPDGAEIAWSDEGAGTPVLLVMGLAYPAAMWWRLTPHLVEAGYRVISFDNRGAGRTGDVVGAPYSVETMADDALAVLAAAGEESAHVVGMSMGGLIAQQVALTAAERVRSLLLAATHPGVAHGVFAAAVTEMLDRRPSLTIQQAAELSIPFNYAPDTPRERIEADWAVRFPLAATADGFVAQWQGHRPWSGLPGIRDLAMPVLVLHGSIDALVVPENGEILAREIPGAEHVVIDGANHLLFTDRPEESRQVVLDWLAKQR